jgi:hypothetical protein
MGAVTEKQERAPVWIRGCQAVFYVAAAALVLFVLFPLGECTQKDRAKRSTTMSRVVQLGQALQNYASDNDGRLPAQFRTNTDLRTSLMDYVREDSVFSTLNPDGGEIVPNSHLAGLKLDSIALPEHTALVYETRAWPEGRTLFGFVDGHARLVTDVSLVVMEPALVVIPRVDTHDTPELRGEAINDER